MTFRRGTTGATGKAGSGKRDGNGNGSGTGAILGQLSGCNFLTVETSYVRTSDLSKAVSGLSYRPTVATKAYKDSR